MTPLRIFVSSVQSEFAQDREALRDYLREDALLRRFFDVFLFEDAPASDQRPDELYLDEVERCDLYVGLFGHDYGNEDHEGLSPTEREFLHATKVGVHRLVFLKAMDGRRHPKMQILIDKAQAGLIRKRFDSTEELKTGLYAALIEYLETKELIRLGPFDATPCPDAVLSDLDFESMTRFIRAARRARNFPLSDNALPDDLLIHLNLLSKERLTNAALLLFGTKPQRFLISSEVKCAHFHGTEVSKPIPSYQVYKGTAFQMVDQAVDFVLSKIALSVGTRAESVQAPVTYEIPKEVVSEAIVNAVAHRDYTSNASVQVMLFADRLEVRNPGGLPPPMTLDMLRVPHNSVPANPLVAQSLYLAEYIERMGTGTLDMIRRCKQAGLPEPEFAVTDGFVTTIRRPLPPAGKEQTPVVVTVRCGGEPLTGIDVLALFPNKTWKRTTTDEHGEAHIELHSVDLPLTVFAAAGGFAACVEYGWAPAERALSLELNTLPGGGAVIFPEATGYIPGLEGRLNPLRDTYDRSYLYASNIAINGGMSQPVDFELREDMHLADAQGEEMRVRVIDIQGRSALVEYRAPVEEANRSAEPESDSIRSARGQAVHAEGQAGIEPGGGPWLEFPYSTAYRRTADSLTKHASADGPGPKHNGSGEIRIGPESAIEATTQETEATTQEIERTTQEDGGATTQETENTTQEIEGTTQERILALLKAEPGITRRLLAERVGITPDGVKYHLDKLRTAGVIRHVGATKAGRWEVLK